MARERSTIGSDPVTNVIYTHERMDHIAGMATLSAAGLLSSELEIHADFGTAAFLRGKNDPARPVPTPVFDDKTTLERGGRRFDLKPTRFHCVTGDLLVTMPEQDVIMAVDVCTPDGVPLIDFDATGGMSGYLGMLDRLASLNFKAFVRGHAGRLATSADVRVTRDYVLDVFKTTKRA